ncbi:glycerophosphodiester phosphodiesterase [Actinomadura rudentiformis]|uniref:Glycerophosphodiester phosphodiesterase n=1 Tax=Actinomadura rudentiformis TaxID=359158 RepID=A0A6H9ZB84_9ACTN|nr:glycerophosphodiester phosphodiesterase [Actinomadura rudentiformis]KAB2351582.1 glycerophosphodiester phosphodiesterase [Actinomadura rudentiformis]
MIFENAPAVIGHRGSGSGDVPLPGPEPIPDPDGNSGPETVAENTIPSMLAALDAGASWIEIDVTRTADDDLVLRHDPTLPGGAFLIDTAAADSGLPRLVEVFDALPAGVPVDVDVKTILEDAVDAPSRRTGALLAPVLRREAGRRPLLVTSFDPSLLLYLQEELPGVPLGLLTWLRFPLWHGVSAAAGLGLQAIGVHTESCGFGHPDTRLRPLEHIVDVAHKAALEFIAWCPAPQDVHAYVAAGVDALVVNDVPGVVGALDAVSR